MTSVFSEITKLKIECIGAITISDDGSIHIQGDSVTFTHTGTTLKIASDREYHHVYGNNSVFANVIGSVGDGGVVIMGNNYGVGQVNMSSGGQVNFGRVGGGMVFNNRAGSTVLNQGVFVNGRVANRGVFVDGRPVIVENDDQQQQEDDPTSHTCKLESSTLSTIELKGSCHVNIQSDLILSKNLTLSLSGSGTILLPAAHFDNLDCNLSGSGDILGGGSKTLATNAHLNLSGSGDIGDICVTKTASCNLVGSGDIAISKMAGAKIKKNLVGSGDIKVKGR